MEVGWPSAGTVFEITKTASGYAPLIAVASFNADASHGAAPAAGLVADSTGNLFGTTQCGGSGSNLARCSRSPKPQAATPVQ